MIRNRHSSSSTTDRLDLRDGEPEAADADQKPRGATSASSQRGAMTDEPADVNDGSARRAASSTGQHTFRFIFQLAVLLIPCALVGWGVILWWTELSTHIECDMTWMRPTYERIASVQHRRYSLYRYRDARDPRPIDFDPRLSPRAALLFVPGHAGSYQQARSLGTHALGVGLTRRNVPPAQLERIRKSILRNDVLNTTTAEDGPSWDVFGVDFREEPTGLHGRYVVEQSEFLAVVSQFLEQLSYREVAIVAHSLGGYSTLLAVARGAERENRRDPSFIRTIIVLASPLRHPVMAWDWTLREIHREIVNHAAKTASDNRVLVSISGGLRDEMIPPRACHAVNLGETISFLAVDLLKPVVDEGKAATSLGMDHRAIVWCHNLLEPMVEALNVLHADNSSPGKVWREQLLQSWPGRTTVAGHSLIDYSYDDAVRRSYAELRVRFGPLRSLAMEASLPYNAEWLLSHYSLIALVYWSLLHDFSSAGLVAIPLVTASIAWVFSVAQPLTWWTHLVLASVAHAVFLGIRNLLRLLQRPNGSLRVGKVPSRSHVLLKTSPLRSSIVMAQVPALLFLAGWVLSCSRARNDRVVRISFVDVVLAAACLVGMYALALYLVVKTNDRRLLVLAAWFLPVLPFLVAGEIAYMILRSEVHGTFWHALLPFVYWLTLQHSLYLARVTGTSHKLKRSSNASTLLRLVAAISCAYRLFHSLWTRHDGDYRPPLVYQVLAFVLVAVASLEAAWEVMSAPPRFVVNEKRT